MDECRRAFQALDQIGLQCILEDGGHGTCGLEVACCDCIAFIGIADDDPAQAGLEVRYRSRETEYGHDLGGNGDVVAVFTRHAVLCSAQAVDQESQLPVVHVHATSPDNG